MKSFLDHNEVSYDPKTFSLKVGYNNPCIRLDVTDAQLDSTVDDGLIITVPLPEIFQSMSSNKTILLRGLIPLIFDQKLISQEKYYNNAYHTLAQILDDCYPMIDQNHLIIHDYGFWFLTDLSPDFRADELAAED